MVWKKYPQIKKRLIMSLLVGAEGFEPRPSGCKPDALNQLS